MDEHCLSFDNGFCYLFLLLFMWHSRGTKPEVLLASTSWCCMGSVLYYHYSAWNHGICEPPCFKKGKHKHLLCKSLSTQFEKWERQQSLAFFEGTSEQPPAPAVLITTEKLAESSWFLSCPNFTVLIPSRTNVKCIFDTHTPHKVAVFFTGVRIHKRIAGVLCSCSACHCQ